MFREWKTLHPDGISNPSELLTIERELLAAIHMTLQMARSCIRESDRSRPLNEFTIGQIERDLEVIESACKK